MKFPAILFLFALGACVDKFEPRESQIPYFPGTEYEFQPGGQPGWAVSSDQLCDVVSRATCGGSDGYEAACFADFSDWQTCQLGVLAECCETWGGCGGAQIAYKVWATPGADGAPELQSRAEWQACMVAADAMDCLERDARIPPPACRDWGFR